MNTFIKTKGLYFVGIIIIIIGWEVTSLICNNIIVFPSIIDIFKSLINIITEKNSYFVLGSSIFRLIISFATSVIIAFGVAYLSRKREKFRKIVAPVITIIKTTPVVSFIIILIIMLGHESSSIVVSFFIMFPILYEGFYNSYNAVSSDLRDEIKMISTVNWVVIKKIYIPIMMPYIITTLLQSVSLGIKSLIMAELITQPKYSIGKELLQYRNALDMSGILAWTIILIIIMIVFELLLNNHKTKIEIS